MKHLVWMGIIVASVLGSGAADAAEAGKNLIRNSGFEMLTEEGIPIAWTPSYNEGAIDIDTATRRDGRISLRFDLDGRETMLGQDKYFKLEPGKTYTFSAYVRTKGLKPASGFQVLIINLGWSFGYQTRLAIPSGSAAWKRYSKTFVCPAASAFKYNGADNDDYKTVIYAKGARGQVWIDALQLEEGGTATAYKAMAGERAPSGDPVYDAVVADLERKGFRRDKYWKVEKPMFEELLSDEPGPDRVLYYGYNDLLYAEVYRPYAKKFGHRYVLADELKELQSFPVIPMTNAWARGGVGVYPTMRMILRHDVQGVAPAVFGKNPWAMHPGWLKAYIETAKKLAEQSTDNSPGNTWGNTWGLWAGDEVFESFGIKEVPKDKWDDAVKAIDQEVREQFGFGKYGIPKSVEDKDPFKRIAFRRWVNARLTGLYKETRPLVKRINPKLALLGPNPCGAVPPVDLEAMTPYFDLVSNQSWYSPGSFTQQLATGADTKAMVDLSSCPVWGLPQHAAAKDAEVVREQFSQVYRNGGEGLIVLAVEWYDRELEHPKFINPEKWRAMVEIIHTVTKMNKVRVPKTADSAILYASDTFLTFDSPKMADADHPHIYAAYAAVGPGTGSWFHFVSDRQIGRGMRSLEDYKILYIPIAPYVQRAVLDRVERFIQSGGTVVCADPEAFTWDVNGEKLSGTWSSVTGVARGKERTGACVARTVDHDLLKGRKPIALTFPGPGYVLVPGDASVEPLAVFEDGAPAAVVRRHGKGRVITFAANPFNSTDKRTPVIELVRSLQLAVGARTDQDIWRFKLPPFKTVHVKDTETHKCLTMNNVIIEGHNMKSVHNLRTRGTYTYDRFPTGIADSAKADQISFFDGHLTNRKLAYPTRHLGGSCNPPELEKWMVSWTDKAPVTLTVDLKKPYALDRLTLFCSGVLPEVKAQSSRDGKQRWTRQSSRPAQAATKDVIDVTLPLKGRHRYIRVTFAAREQDATMELCEMEIWGDP